MIRLQNRFKPDLIGAVASGLCLIHCIITPFIFIVKACSVTCCADTPIWWQAVDYIFLIISFTAIWHATKSSSKKWLQIALWGSWILLLAVIVTESIGIIFYPKAFSYIPAFTIIGLHLYNYKYCNCASDNCYA